MGILTKTLTITASALALVSGVEAVEVVRPGLNLEVIYCENESGANGCATTNHLSERIRDMAIDPVSGNLFIGQQFEDTSVISEGGNIIAIDPDTGEVVDLGMRRKTESGAFENVPYIPFFSRGMDFADDGTLYFGVSNLMLATWRRDGNASVFRTLTSIPLIIDVEVEGSDVYVGVDARGGPTSIYRDAILQVDPADGYFEPVFTVDEILEAGVADSEPSIMARIAIADNGDLYAGFSKGEVFKKAADGSISQINVREQTAGGVNNTDLEQAGNMAFELDNASGHLYAVMPDGSLTLVAYADEFASGANTDSGMVYDGNALYFINANRTLYKLSATSGDLVSSVSSSLGTVNLTGVTHFQVSTTETAIMPEATVTLGSGQSTVSDENGEFTFTGVPAGLHEVIVSKANYNPGYVSVVAESGTVTVPTATDAVVSQLPAYIAPGLDVEIIADSTDGINGSSDITMDINGDLYVMNNSDSKIMKIDMTADTREKVSTYPVVEGVGGGSSWFVAVDQSLNIYSSFANDGVFKVQEIPDGVVSLTQDSSNPEIVRDNSGNNVMISTAKDVDGAAVLSDGSLIMASGSGGTDTFNTLVRHFNGSDSEYSDGTPAGGGSPVLSNPDLLKVGADDVLFSTNSNGNVVRIETDGTAELIWPGDGSGRSESIGGYSNFSEDFNGNMFVRGSFGGAPTEIEANGSLRMISSDRSSLITAVAGIRSWSGVTWEGDGQSVFVANKNFIYRVSSLDDRTIAANLLDESYTPPTKINFDGGDLARPFQYDPSFYDSITVQWGLLSEASNSETPVEEATPSSSGAIHWFMLLLLSGLVIRRGR